MLNHEKLDVYKVSIAFMVIALNNVRHCLYALFQYLPRYAKFVHEYVHVHEHEQEKSRARANRLKGGGFNLVGD